MDQETLRLLITTLAALAGAFVGAFVPSLFNYLSNRAARKTQERGEYREMIVRVAMEHWKETAEFANQRGRPGEFSPLDVFMLHTAKTADVLFDPTTNKQNLAERLKEVDEIVAIMTDRADRLRAESLLKKPTS